MSADGAFGKREWSPTPQPSMLAKPRYMMATVAMHKLGDISSETPDICHVNAETELDYIGSWVTGFGFVEVKFPKATTRELTEDEKAHYRKCHYQLADHPPQRLNIP